MKRRTVLASVALVTTGCLSNPPASAPSTSATRSAPTEEPQATDGAAVSRGNGTDTATTGAEPTGSEPTGDATPEDGTRTDSSRDDGTSKDSSTDDAATDGAETDGDPVVDATLAAEDGDCASERGHAGTIAFDDASVSIDGSVATPNPCYELSFDSLASQDDGETLVVDVAADSSDDVCVQCLGSVDYEASVAFESVSPTQVVLAHVVDGDRTVVARESK